MKERKNSLSISAIIFLLASFLFMSSGVVSADEKVAKPAAEMDKKTDGDKKKKDAEEPDCD